MIVHQAIGPYLHTVLSAVVYEALQVIIAPFIVKKDRTAVVPPLGHMMRIIHNHNSCYSRHSSLLNISQ